MDRIERALERSRRERLNAPAAFKTQRDVAPPLNAPEAGPATGPDAGPRTKRVHLNPVALRRAGIVPADLAGPVGHSIKLLRAMVMQRMNKHGWNTLAVVSPGSEDGKTFVAANLAVAIAAEHNLTALLVDLDLRLPRVSERFGIQPEIGVEDCLGGKAAVADALLAPEEYPGLVLLPARATVNGSSELLGGQRARDLFRELKQRYVNRIVIYDLPPVLASDDALVFAPQADAVLVVIGDNRTRRDELNRCLALLEHVPVLGTVLNGAGQRDARPGN